MAPIAATTGWPILRARGCGRPAPSASGGGASTAPVPSKGSASVSLRVRAATKASCKSMHGLCNRSHADCGFCLPRGGSRDSSSCNA